MRARLSGNGRTSVLVFATVAAVTLGCAGAPPPAEANKPSAVVTPIATATASASASVTKSAPPPLVIASKYKADKDDPLPPGAVMRCGTNRMRAIDPQAVAVTNEGRVWLLDRRDGRSRLVDANRGVEVASLGNSSRNGFAPDGSRVFIQGIETKNDVVTYSVPDGKRVGRVEIPLKGQMTVKLGKKTQKLDVYVDRMMVSPDGAALVVLGTDGSAHVVDVPSQKVVKSLPPQPKSEVTSISRGAARAVVETFDRDLEVWSLLSSSAFAARVSLAVVDLRTGATLRKETFPGAKLDPTNPDSPTVRPHEDAVYRLSPDGATLYRLESGAIVAVDVATGKESDVTDGATSGAPGPYPPRLDPMHGLVSRTTRFDVTDGGLAILDDFVVNLKDGSMKASLSGEFLAISPDGNHGLEKHDRRLVRIPFDEETPRGHESDVTGLAFRSDNRLVSAGQGAFVWSTDDCATNDKVYSDAETVAATPGSDAVLLLFGTDVGILGEDRTVTKVRDLTRPQIGALTPDGTALFVAFGDTYERYRLERRVLGVTDEKPKEMRFPGEILAMAMSPDGETLSVVEGSSYQGSLALHRMSTTSEMGELAQTSLHDFEALAVAGNDTLLTAARYRGVAVRSPQTLAATRHLHYGYCCTALAASQDGRYAAGASNEGFVVWEVASGRVVGEVPRAHRDRIVSLAFSADGKHLATGSRDTTILVWDVAKLPQHVFAKPVTKVSGAADVTAYLAGGFDGYRVGADGSVLAPPKAKKKAPPLKSVTRLAGTWGTECAISEGKVRCWGSTANGLLGVPEQTTGPKKSIVEKDAPVTLPVTDPVDLKVNRGYACALQKDSALVCWGRLKYTSKEGAPATILRGVKSFDLSGYGPCAVLTDGAVSCWSDGVPPAPVSLPGPAAQIVGNGSYRCVLFVDGAVRCTGENDSDQLGDGTGLTQSGYVSVVDLPPATELAADVNMTCALTKAGEVMCWGHLGDTQLGRATRISGLDGATTLRVSIWDGICGRIGDRIDCVSPKVPR